MKILKLLSKYFIIFIAFTFLVSSANSNEPVDIWNLEKTENIIQNKLTETNKENINDDTIKGIEIGEKNKSIIVNNSLGENDIKLAGLYDPAENGLSIDMWSYSNGDEIKSILNELNSKNLSNFSEKILDVALLTNSYLPSNNISNEEFLDFKFQYLINKKDFNLIKNFIIKNPSIKNNDKLIRFYADYHLSNSQIDKSCEIFNYADNVISDYLNNFKII